MSKAFTRDEADGTPLVVPPRAPLAEGVTNYVTQRGLACLREELERLEAERAASSDPHTVATLGARISELGARIATAVTVDPATQSHDEVRFGATATVRTESGEVRRYQVVGVDEADVEHGRVAFVAPLARALLGKEVGDTARVRTPRGIEKLEVIAISYEDA
jgi:transcription elongation factor GreB